MSELRCLTWNVWFGAHAFEARAYALIEEILRRSPDVAALQEVTPELLAIFLEDGRIPARYHLSDDDGSSLGDYGVLLLSKRRPSAIRYMPLPTLMGRKVLCAAFEGIHVLTVHLESTLPCALERAKQLEIIARQLPSFEGDVLLCGDMNFAPGAPLEERALDPSLVDLWPALMGSDPGYTVDSDRNPMRLLQGGRASHKRIDRVFLRAPFRAWRPSAIEIVGVDPIDIDGTFVSDHFGLLATLTPA